ncbi:hypothetical protein D3C71_2007190 [compost metagenome]
MRTLLGAAMKKRCASFGMRSMTPITERMAGIISEQIILLAKALPNCFRPSRTSSVPARMLRMEVANSWR